jgi:hypothetical protein
VIRRKEVIMKRFCVFSVSFALGCVCAFGVHAADCHGKKPAVVKAVEVDVVEVDVVGTASDPVVVVEEGVVVEGKTDLLANRRKAKKEFRATTAAARAGNKLERKTAKAVKAADKVAETRALEEIYSN